MAVKELKFSNEELMNMEFNDPFELEEPGKYEEDDCCYICGDLFENLSIGFNEKEQLFRYECENCDSVYILPQEISGRIKNEVILIKGEERDWPEYLSEVLEFPVDATVIEATDAELFNENYDGPSKFDDVEILEVFYSFKYGVDAVIRKEGEEYLFILSFLEVDDWESQDYIELENYKRWRMKYWSSDYLVAFLEAFGKKK